MNMDPSTKNLNNNLYQEILNNFLKLNRHICSSVISADSSIQINLLHGLTLFFIAVFPQLKVISQNDYVIINDTIILLCEALKTIVDNSLMKEIFTVFISFIKSEQNELVKNKINDIIKNVFYCIENYNADTYNVFTNFCFDCMQIDKNNFLNILKEIFNSNEYKKISEKNKESVIKYIDYYWNDKNKLKNICNDLINIMKNMYNQDVLDEYRRALMKATGEYYKIQNVKNVVIDLNQIN